jgi:heat shock protein HslJ
MADSEGLGMNCSSRIFRCAATALLLGLCVPAFAQAQLEGTSWTMVRFQSMDDSVLTPADPTRYTLGFAGHGRLRIRADCNRAQAGWKTDDASSLRISHMVMTRVRCSKRSLSARFLRDLAYVRTYTFRDDHLFLALKADAGIYEFAPMPGGIAHAPLHTQTLPPVDSGNPLPCDAKG